MIQSQILCRDYTIRNTATKRYLRCNSFCQWQTLGNQCLLGKMMMVPWACANIMTTGWFGIKWDVFVKYFVRDWISGIVCANICLLKIVFFLVCFGRHVTKLLVFRDYLVAWNAMTLHMTQQSLCSVVHKICPWSCITMFAVIESSCS